LGVPARALSSVAHVEKFLDVRKPQTHTFARADEVQSLYSVFTIEAVTSGCPLRSWQQTKPLVITQRVGAQPE